MSRFLGRYSPIVFALMRLIVGLMFACHGGQKILGMFPDPSHAMPSPVPTIVIVGGWIELIGGFMIALGLLGDWAAFICSGQMAVAYFMMHAKHGILPIQNNGDSAVLYCWIFLYIAFHGSGILSLDYLLFRRTDGIRDQRTTGI